MALVQGKQILLSTVNPTPSSRNKNMAASTTAADHDEACADTIDVTPAPSTNADGEYVAVRVNGVGYVVGNGTRVGVDCYFSGDAGATARAFSAIVAGDKLYWNGSVAGFQLAAATDKIDFLYDESP
jgi:hypothetical protein